MMRSCSRGRAAEREIRELRWFDMMQDEFARRDSRDLGCAVELVTVEK